MGWSGVLNTKFECTKIRYNQMFHIKKKLGLKFEMLTIE